MLYTILIRSPTTHRVKLNLVLEDPGSNHNFVTHDLAKKLQLSSEITVAIISLVGRQGAVTQTKVYRMCLSDMQGRKHQVEAIGMDSLLAIYQAVKQSF